MPATDQWNEKLCCPSCGKTGMASVSQIDDDRPVVESVPNGFEVVAREHGPDFICATCNVTVMP